MASINKRKGLITGTDANEDFASIYCEVIRLFAFHLFISGAKNICQEIFYILFFHLLIVSFALFYII